MQIVTTRLVLSPLTSRDIDAFVAYRQQPEVARYQSWDLSYSAADAERLVREQEGVTQPAPGEWVQIGIRERGLSASMEGALVGDVAVGADALQPDTYELGVTLAPSAQGKGYALEAVSAVRDALFSAGAHRIVMQGDTRNAAVVRLMTKLGLRHEATLRDADWFKGEWTTLECFAQLRSEWSS